MTMINEKEIGALNALQTGILEGVTRDTLVRLYTSYMLERHGHNHCKTASALGMDRRTIQRWKRQGKLRGEV